MSNIAYPDVTFTAKLQGGLGNQLFQISLAYAMSVHFGAQCKFKRSQFDGCRQGSHPNKYYESLYKKIQFVDDLSIDCVIKEPHFAYCDVLPDIQRALTQSKKVIAFEGYWQSDLYFQGVSNELRALFMPDIGPKEYLQTKTNVFQRYPELEAVTSDDCFIGVRRGDYVKFAHVHNPCGMKYFSTAINEIQKKRYFIFSDDLEWCRKHFLGSHYIFVDLADDLEAFFAMCLFQNYIISNSTFHWWATFLSVCETPVIYAPDKWIGGPNKPFQSYRSIYRTTMKIVQRPIEAS